MAREWRSIIPYEDRSDHLTTSRWALDGVNTIEGGENTDSGVVWLKTTKAGDTVTATLYKDDGLASGNSVATGTADVSGCDNTGANAAEVALTQANSSGLSGAFWIHQYVGDDNCPLQVTLCVDEDLDALYDGIEVLPTSTYNATTGMAEFIRVAGDDVISAMLARFEDELGGYSAAEAWYITDATRAYPDLRRIANPAQLRRSCAHRALALSLGRSHNRADETTFSELRDYHNAEYMAALESIVLAIKTGSGDDAIGVGTSNTVRLERA